MKSATLRKILMVPAILAATMTAVSAAPQLTLFCHGTNCPVAVASSTWRALIAPIRWSAARRLPRSINSRILPRPGTSPEQYRHEGKDR